MSALLRSWRGRSRPQASGLPRPADLALSTPLRACSLPERRTPPGYRIADLISTWRACRHRPSGSGPCPRVCLQATPRPLERASACSAAWPRPWRAPWRSHDATPSQPRQRGTCGGCACPCACLEEVRLIRRLAVATSPRADSARARVPNVDAGVRGLSTTVLRVHRDIPSVVQAGGRCQPPPRRFAMS